MNKIYLVTRTDKWSYDDYDSFVCVAETEEEARRTWPDEYFIRENDKVYFLFADGTKRDETDSGRLTWTKDLNQIDVEEVGVALDSTPKGVILASFNAG